MLDSVVNLVGTEIVVFHVVVEAIVRLCLTDGCQCAHSEHIWFVCLCSTNYLVSFATTNNLFGMRLPTFSANPPFLPSMFSLIKRVQHTHVSIAYRDHFLKACMCADQ